MRIIPPYLDYKYFRARGNAHADLCDLAILAYAEPAFIIEQIGNSPFRFKNIITRNDIQMVLVERGVGEAVVAFRGTMTLQDWIADFDFPLNQNGVHSGFAEAFKPFAGELEQFILGKAVIAIGHSLGGALATEAVDAVVLEHQQAELVTFGSPRVGNYAFAERVRAKSQSNVRYVHGEDVVPFVPFCAMEYEHVAPATHFLQMPRPWSNIFCPRQVFDHVPTNYAERLWNSV